jgi:hypothetical protein
VLLVKLKEGIDFKGSCLSLRGIIRGLRFRWNKTRREKKRERCSLKAMICDLYVYFS